MIKTFGLFAVMVLVSSELFAQAVTIRGVRLSGSGCGPATATAVVTPDGQTMSVLFDHYSSEIGQGSENPQMRVMKKDCNVMIDVDVPMGMQYAISQTDYRGFAALPATAFGYHRFTQVIPGAAMPSMREAQLRGPQAQNYSVTVMQKPGREIYSKCNNRSQTINLLSELMVSYLPNTNDRTMAQINLDSADTGVDSSFKFIWRSCR